MSESNSYSSLKEERSRRRGLKYNTKTGKKASRFRINLASYKFLSPVISFFKDKNILTKIGFTLFLVIIYRILAAIPLPGLDMQVYKDYFGTANASEASYLLLLFTGGQLDSPSVVGLGLAAFINASIIIQLLTPVIPHLTDLSKEGERGRQMINQYTRYLTLPLGFIYSIAYLMLIARRDLNSSDGTTISENPVYLIPHAVGSDWPTITKLFFMALILTAGTLLLMWISEIITERGLGNGSSVIISVGILASLPALLDQDFSQIRWRDFFADLIGGNFSVLTDSTFVTILGVTLGFILVIYLIVFITESTRKIDIQYARRLRLEGNTQKSNLPIKLTLAGVIPIIFASALISVPQLIVPFMKNSADEGTKIYEILTDIESSFLFSTNDNIFDRNDVYYTVLYFILIIVFGMFYAFIVMKPAETAENLQKSGAFVPGIRPGKSTERYISIVLLRLSFAGSLFLAFIAIIPQIARNLIVNYSEANMLILSGIGGTSILIIVGVILDTLRQYNSLVATKSYEKYI